MCSFVSVCVLSLEFLSACVPVVGSVSVCSCTCVHVGVCDCACVFLSVSVCLRAVVKGSPFQVLSSDSTRLMHVVLSFRLCVLVFFWLTVVTFFRLSLRYYQYAFVLCCHGLFSRFF